MDRPLVEVTRGDVVERIHRGGVVVVDADGTVLHALGDPQAITTMRSAAKPIQVLPLLLAGGMERFGFTDRDLAMMCSSHYGEPFHIEILESMLGKTGLREADLRCGAIPSINLSHALRQARLGVRLNQLHSDCSGKHLGMLALCLLRGYPLADYVLPDHPVQRDILETFAGFCGMAPGDVRIGVDGCSAPVFALPLQRMAMAYARLVRSDSAPQPLGRALSRVVAAMTGHPKLIAGSGGFCSELMGRTGGRLVGKIGADGVYCVGLAARGLGLAVKIADGNMAVLSTVVLQALDDLGALTGEEKRGLRGFWYRDVLNDRGQVVGVQRPSFRL